MLVGGRGGDGIRAFDDGALDILGGAAGLNGGAAGGEWHGAPMAEEPFDHSAGAGGGGFSEVRLNGGTIAIAAGGGGAAATAAGGDGGAEGEAGGNATGGEGGTAVAGGASLDPEAGAGTALSGGEGADSGHDGQFTIHAGGGGAGGLFGGAGGGDNNSQDNGGGGGSSLVPADGTVASGIRAGDGQVLLTVSTGSCGQPQPDLDPEIEPATPVPGRPTFTG